MYIHEAIKAIPVENQIDLAKKLGVAQATISNYANGNVYPQLRVAGRIYGIYEMVVEPFTETAVRLEWEHQCRLHPTPTN